MKKLRYGLLTALFAVVCLCALAGCGSKAGVYKFSSMEVKIGEETKTLKVGDKFEGLLGLSFEIEEDLYSLELLEDGTFTLTVGHDIPRGLSAKAGTWKEVEGDSGKIDLNGIVVECNGSKITMDVGGFGKVILKK